MTPPLLDRTILVTRQIERGTILRAGLSKAGAEVVHVPTIEVAALPASVVLPRLARLLHYDWLLLTSRNSVETLSTHSRTLGVEPEDWPPVCAIGSATAEAVRALGVATAQQPRDSRSEGIVEYFRSRYGGSLGGLRFLLPRARVARTLLPDALSRAGALVDVVPLYENRLPESSRRPLRKALESGLDLITFTSASTAAHLVTLAEPFPTRGLPCAVIGPITAAAARRLGLDVVAVAAEPSSEALVEACVGYFEPPV